MKTERHVWRGAAFFCTRFRIVSLRGQRGKRVLLAAIHSERGYQECLWWELGYAARKSASAVIMNTKSISNPNLLRILDESTHKASYGCDQEWYPTELQRLSGCGPSVACTIMSYLNHARSPFDLEQSFTSKENCLFLMEEIWGYVTPTKEGIPATKMFCEAVLAYTKSKDLHVEYGLCDVPEDKSLRPALTEVLIFLEEALLKDAPIAFLNLCNGDEKNLERWHWVTIISLECAKHGDGAFVNILDEGLIKKIDLALWYNTTTLGGGFAYFTASPGITDK